MLIFSELCVIFHNFCALQAEKKKGWQIANTPAVLLVGRRYNIKHEAVY